MVGFATAGGGSAFLAISDDSSSKPKQQSVVVGVMPGLLHDARELDLILCEHHARKLTKNLTLSFECGTYQVTGQGRGYRLRGAEVTVCKGFDGRVAAVLREGRELPARLLGEDEPAAEVADEKTVRDRVAQVRAAQRSRPDYKPAVDHPWRRAFKPGAADADPVGARCRCRRSPAVPPRKGTFLNWTGGDISALR